jgi:hypothetical protein
MSTGGAAGEGEPCLPDFLGFKRLVYALIVDRLARWDEVHGLRRRPPPFQAVLDES